ncbi:hypothetical protein [Thermosulfurimonas sp.]|uniref:hypothetical protein n=1 Tax=Thermosulfurimonas sp. TaxID=2080236 RepID=UPI0025D85013|nr:hypothetical protein [Thermosulfurimonas sp.]
MQCKRLRTLAREWFLKVREDALAPARMMEFIHRHVRQCSTCQADPDLPQEIEKIREFIRAPEVIPSIQEISEDLEEEKVLL